MDQAIVAIVVAIAGLLLHASWQLATVAAKLDSLCDRLILCEKQTEANIQRLHERVDSVESKITNRPHGSFRE